MPVQLTALIIICQGRLACDFGVNQELSPIDISAKVKLYSKLDTYWNSIDFREAAVELSRLVEEEEHCSNTLPGDKVRSEIASKLRHLLQASECGSCAETLEHIARKAGESTLRDVIAHLAELLR